MKIPFVCIQCTQEDANRQPKFVKLTPMESGIYDVRCDHGHSTLTLLQQMRFEILFEVGVTAIKDGYFREAVSSFAASLERFFEFYIEMVFSERKADSKLRTQVWKNVAAQSERQLGAYLFLFAIHENERPAYLSDDQVKFRNAVIHKGRFPTETEAIEFGNAVMRIINPIIRKIKERSQRLLLEAVMRHMDAVLSSAKADVKSNNCHNTTISLASDLSVPDCKDIRERIKLL